MSSWSLVILIGLALPSLIIFTAYLAYQFYEAGLISNEIMLAVIVVVVIILFLIMYFKTRDKA